MPFMLKMNSDVPASFVAADCSRPSRLYCSLTNPGHLNLINLQCVYYVRGEHDKECHKIKRAHTHTHTHTHTHKTMRYSHLVYLQKVKLKINFREAQNLIWRTFFSATRATA